MTQLEEWQVKRMEDTFRLVANYFHSERRETCLDRMIMQAWNWVTDALNDVPIDVTSDNGIMYYMRIGQRPECNKKDNLFYQLTWQDIRLISEIGEDFLNSENSDNLTEEEYYTIILNKFNEGKIKTSRQEIRDLSK